MENYEFVVIPDFVSFGKITLTDGYGFSEMSFPSKMKKKINK